MAGTVTVVNVRDKVPGAIYIGRLNTRHHLPQSPLANPYPVGKYGAQAMPLFIDWFEREMKRGKDRHRFMVQLVERVLAGEDLALACWCKTKANPNAPCHGDVIKMAIEWLVQKAEFKG